MMGKVTVVIPVYNTKVFLEDCVRSVVEQTYKDIEILLIDDGSTDGSSELCDELGKCDSRIRVIHKKNGGVAQARNTGVDEATGEYIAFLDSDDWISGNMIESLMLHIDKNDADVIKFNYVREFRNKSYVKRNSFLEERVYLEDECKTLSRQVLGLVGHELLHIENMNFLASCWSNIYKRKFLLDIGIKFTDIWEIGSFEDGLFNFSVYMKMQKFEYIDEAFYHYRKNNVSETTGYRINYPEKRIALAERLRLQAESSGMWEFYEEAYNNRLVHSIMEIAFNSLRNPASFKVRYDEIKRVLNHVLIKNASCRFSLSDLDLKWKVYFFFIKHSMVFPTYAMTALILKLKNRGVR